MNKRYRKLAKILSKQRIGKGNPMYGNHKSRKIHGNGSGQLLRNFTLKYGNKKICFICGTKTSKRFEKHHINYLYKSINDMKWLCWHCHRLVHAYLRLRKIISFKRLLNKLEKICI